MTTPPTSPTYTRISTGTKTHPLIELMRRLKKRKFDRLRRSGPYGPSSRTAPGLKPIVPFTNRIPEERWSKENAEKFIDLLRQFYAETRCGDFFDSQHTRYEHAEKAYNKQLRHIDLKWFPAYYGINSEDTFHLIVGLGNGSNCYGLSIDRPDRTRDIFFDHGRMDVRRGRQSRIHAGNAPDGRA